MNSIFTRSSVVAVLAAFGLAFSGCAQWGQDRQEQQESQVWGEEQSGTDVGIQGEQNTGMTDQRDPAMTGQHDPAAMGQDRESQAWGEGHEGEDTVKRAQKALQQDGYLDEQQVDGQFGSQTERAVRAFQAAEGLEISGQLDDETLSALNVERGEAQRRPAGVEGYDKQPHDMKKAQKEEPYDMQTEEEQQETQQEESTMDW